VVPKVEVSMLHDHVSSSTRHSWPKTLRFVSALSLLALTMLGGLGACGSDPPPFCVGGIVAADGRCEGICDPTKCLEGNICVDNRCVLECATHADCLEDGTQNCSAATEDGTSRATMTCQPNGKNWGIGTKCPFGDECATVFSCSTTGAYCDPTHLAQLAQQCGGDGSKCVRDAATCYAQTNCTIGKCPDGNACTVMPCQAAECTANLSCVTKGDADADAYCSKNDCQADADCPGGYYCGVTRDPRELCDSMPPKGNSNFCGKVSINTPCVPTSDLGNGNTLFEGQGCILQKTCLKRNECAPCEADIDCSQGIANHCITMPMEAQKRCAKACNVDADCGRDFACQDSVSAGKVCVHRFGACEGTGKFCEPCLDDTDCGPITGTSVCFTHNDGQRGCGDISFPTKCVTSADCPKSPSGEPAFCVDDPGSDIYQRCYIFAYVDLGGGNVKTTCW